MSTETAIARTSAGVITTMTAQESAELFSKLVLNNDLAPLTPPERVEYYKLVCTRLGLDPYRKPFDLVALSGKLQLYANKECTAQLTALRRINVTIVERAELDGLFMVTARATTADGATAEDIGVTNIAGLTNDAKANAMMKAATKAKRRAILGACGLGMIDESERETVLAQHDVEPLEVVPDVVDDDAQQALADWRVVLDEVQTAEELTGAFVQYRERLPADVRKHLQPVLQNAMTRLRVRWDAKASQFVEMPQ